MRSKLMAIATVLIVGSATSANAATWYVDCEGCGDGADGLGWATALCSVQEAVDLAAPGDDIWVREGRCTEGITLGDGLTLYGGFDGSEATPEARTPGHTTTIDAEDLDPRRSTMVISGVFNVTVDGFTLNGGYGEQNPFASGGNVWIYQSGSIAITNCTITDGYAKLGGGIASQESLTTITDCHFEDNIAVESGAGFSSLNGEAIVTGSTFLGNRTNGFGGGLSALNGSIEITDCTFSENYAREGGGVIGSRCEGLIANSRFLGNECGSNGGGMSWYHGELSVLASEFHDNISGFSGGAIEVLGSESSLIRNVIFANNSARTRGGAINVNVPEASVINSTFADNSAGLRGGAIHIQGSDVSIANSIFWGTVGSTIHEQYPSSTSSLVSNLFFANPGGYYFDYEDENIDTLQELNAFENASDNIEGAPRFVSPGTDNFRIGLDSMARDNASAAFAPPFDFEGDPRPGPGGAVDIGADEIADTTPPEVTDITTDAPALSNLDEIAFQVSFSEFVDGVSTDDFAAITTGLTGVSIRTVASLYKAASLYDVRVNLGTGSGTVALSVQDDDSIFDLGGNPLGGVGTGNGDFIGTQTITIDRSPPVITINGANPLTLEAGSATPAFNVEANDNIDGDLTAQLERTSTPALNTTVPGSYALTFQVEDTAGNLGVSGILTVNVVDTTAPTIALLGQNPLTLGLGEAYAEPGAVAIDIVEGDLSDAVTTKGSVNEGVEGSYEITYAVSDSEGNAATATRTVIVQDLAPDFRLLPAVQAVGAAATDVTFNVLNTGDTTQSWSTTLTAGGGWAIVTGGATGTDNGTITVSVAENTTTEERTATIQIASTSKEALPLEATIVQAPGRKTTFFGCGSALERGTGAPLGDYLSMVLLAITLVGASRIGRQATGNHGQS